MTSLSKFWARLSASSLRFCMARSAASARNVDLGDCAAGAATGGGGRSAAPGACEPDGNAPEEYAAR